MLTEQCKRLSRKEFDILHSGGTYRRFLQRWRKHIDGVVLLVGCSAPG